MSANGPHLFRFHLLVWMTTWLALESPGQAAISDSITTLLNDQITRATTVDELFDLASTYRDQDQLEAVIALYALIQSRCETNGDMACIAKVYERKGNYYTDILVDSALHYYLLAVDLYEQQGDISNQAYALRESATALTNLGEFQRSLQIQEKALIVLPD